MTFFEKFIDNLILKVQHVWKIWVFHCYTWKYQKISIKMKNFKTFYEAKKENCSAPHQIKASHVSGIYIFLPWYTETYRHLFSKCFENVLFRKRKGAEKVHCKCYSFFSFIFLTPIGNMLAVKILNVRKVFGCVVEVYFIPV